mgnify:CR=1 FL=1
MLYKEMIELFDILDSASASGSEVVEYLKAINPRCQAETYPLAGPNGHTDMVRILIPGKNGKSKVRERSGSSDASEDLARDLTRQDLSRTATVH